MRRHGRRRDDQRERIEDLLPGPGREGHVGVMAKGDRLFVEALLHRYRAGIPWRGLPGCFGDRKRMHTRFGRLDPERVVGARVPALGERRLPFNES